MDTRILENSVEISALREGVKSAHKRIDETDKMISGIHKLALNVEALAVQVKLLTESMDNSIEELKGGLQRQGARIGNLENKPAARWESLVACLISAAVSTAIALTVNS